MRHGRLLAERHAERRTECFIPARQWPLPLRHRSRRVRQRQRRNVHGLRHRHRLRRDSERIDLRLKRSPITQEETRGTGQLFPLVWVRSSARQNVTTLTSANLDCSFARMVQGCDEYRRRAVRSRAVAQLAVRVIAPAVHGSDTRQSTAVESGSSTAQRGKRTTTREWKRLARRVYTGVAEDCTTFSADYFSRVGNATLKPSRSIGER